MSTDHPITPPPDLVDQWHKEACKDPYNGGTFFESKTLKYISTQAANWGADTELEACCEWLDSEKILCKDGGYIRKLRTARRPKPPSLKEQALMALEDGDLGPGASLTPVEVCIIRRALEALPE